MVNVPTFRLIRSAVVAFGFLFFFIACKGPQGEPGANGANGATGNANVMQFSFGSRTHTGSEQVFTLTGIPADMITKSAVFVYASNANPWWYPLPGIFNGANEYRTNIRPSANSQVAVVRVSGGPGGSDTFTNTRIVLIPANDLRNGRRAAVDFADYESVRAFYHLLN